MPLKTQRKQVKQMAEKELNITWCYPDILNLHGDRGNVMALRRVAELLGLQGNIRKIESFRQGIDFDRTDILLFSPGEVKSMAFVAEGLRKQEDALRQYVESGGVILVVGTTGAVFGKELLRLDGSVVQGFGFLDMQTAERDFIFWDDLLFRLTEEESMEIVGSQVQIVDMTLHSGAPLGQIVYGRGNNESAAKTEGAQYKNLYFTNALGPVLVKNPWFAEHLIRKAMARKGVSIMGRLDEGVYGLEQESMACIKAFIHKTENKI